MPEFDRFTGNHEPLVPSSMPLGETSPLGGNYTGASIAGAGELVLSSIGLPDAQSMPQDDNALRDLVLAGTVVQRGGDDLPVFHPHGVNGSDIVFTTSDESEFAVEIGDLKGPTEPPTNSDETAFGAEDRDGPRPEIDHYVDRREPPNASVASVVNEVVGGAVTELFSAHADQVVEDHETGTQSLVVTSYDETRGLSLDATVLDTGDIDVRITYEDDHPDAVAATYHYKPVTTPDVTFYTVQDVSDEAQPADFRHAEWTARLQVEHPLVGPKEAVFLRDALEAAVPPVTTIHELVAAMPFNDPDYGDPARIGILDSDGAAEVFTEMHHNIVARSPFHNPEEGGWERNPDLPQADRMIWGQPPYGQKGLRIVASSFIPVDGQGLVPHLTMEQVEPCGMLDSDVREKLAAAGHSLEPGSNLYTSLVYGIVQGGLQARRLVSIVGPGQGIPETIADKTVWVAKPHLHRLRQFLRDAEVKIA